MQKIKLNWITGKRLIERWNLDIRELHLCIQSGLPVYNPTFELEAWGPINNEILNPNYDPNDIYSERYIVNQNNLHYLQVLLDSPSPIMRTGLTKDQILNNLFFKMEDVKQFEAKYGEKADLTAHSKDTGSVMPQIKVPWMNGKRLMKRWDIYLDELYQAIFFLHLPVHNSDYEKQDCIIWEESTTYTGGENGEEPIAYTEPQNNLYELDQLTNMPNWPYIYGERVDKVLCSLLFYLSDVENFEKKYSSDKDILISDKDIRIPSAAHQDETVKSSGTMSKIKMPWINGKHLMKRWEINLDELHQAIFDKQLPVYNRHREKLGRKGIKTIFGDPLADLHQLTGHPTWPDIWGESVDEMLYSLQFKMEDVENFEQKYGEYKLIDGNADPHQDEATETSVEDFIRNLRVSYENDSEIKIREPGKKANPFTCQSLGFRDNQTKEWKTLIRILQDIPPTYCLGPAHENVNGKKQKLSFYDAQQKLLGEINNKLVNFLNKNYPVNIPKNYKLYELCEGEKSGTYQFKFRVIGETESSKNQIIDEINNLCHKYKKTQNDTIKERITGLAKIAEDNGWLTSNEIREILEPDKEKEKIIYDPFENKEDLEPNY